MTKHDSMLRAIASGAYPSAVDGKQRILLDLDGETFRHTLNYLRHHLIPPALPAQERAALKAQADALCLAPLSDRLALDDRSLEVMRQPTLHKLMGLADGYFDNGDEDQAWLHHARAWDQIRFPADFEAYVAHYAAEAQEDPSCPWRALLSLLYATSEVSLDKASLPARCGELDAESIVGMCWKAVQCAASGQHEEARAHTEEALAARADAAEAWCLLGIVRQAGAEGGSQFFFRRAAELRPKCPRANLGWASALGEQGEHALALEKYRQVLSVSDKWSPAHLGRGHALLALKRPGEALQAFEAAGGIEAARGRASALQSLGRLDEALVAIRLYLAARPDDVEAHFQAGIVLRQKSDSQGALAKFEDVARLQPSYPNIHGHRGDQLRRLRRFEEALAAYKLELQLRPDNIEAHGGRGYLYLYDLNDPPAAQLAFEAALALRKDAPKAQRWLGEALHRQGRLQEALSAYTQSLSVEKTAIAYALRGACHLDLNDLSAAAADSTHALGLDPTSTQAREFQQKVHRLQRLVGARAGSLQGEALAAAVAAERGVLDFIEGQYKRCAGMMGPAVNKMRNGTTRLELVVLSFAESALGNFKLALTIASVLRRNGFEDDLLIVAEAVARKGLGQPLERAEILKSLQKYLSDPIGFLPGQIGSLVLDQPGAAAVAVYPFIADIINRRLKRGDSSEPLVPLASGTAPLAGMGPAGGTAPRSSSGPRP